MNLSHIRELISSLACKKPNLFNWISSAPSPAVYWKIRELFMSGQGQVPRLLETLHRMLCDEGFRSKVNRFHMTTLEHRNIKFHLAFISKNQKSSFWFTLDSSFLKGLWKRCISKLQRLLSFKRLCSGQKLNHIIVVECDCQTIIALFPVYSYVHYMLRLASHVVSLIFRC